MRIVQVALALAVSAGWPGLAATQGDGLRYGDDSSEYAQDGECDDRRFTGGGMAADLSWDHVGRDAADCRRLCAFGVLGLRDYRSY